MASPIPKESAALNPEKIQQIGFSFAAARVLATSIQLKVFSHIAAGHKTTADVANAACSSRRGIRMLLDALVALELLTKAEERYELTPLAAEFLICDSPNYVGAVMESDSTWEAWGHLTEVVRSGRPYRHIEDLEIAERFFPILIRSLHVLNLEPARRAAQALGFADKYKAARVLDVACGSAIWSIAVAEADKDAHITAQDLPEVLKETRQYIMRHGLIERSSFLPGDLKEIDFGDQQYDLAFLCNILHSLGEHFSRDLLKKIYLALKPGGRVAIVDKIPNDDRTGPSYPLLFAINMLLNTEDGDTFSLAEYQEWLNEAGFVQVETVSIGMQSPLIIARKT